MCEKSSKTCGICGDKAIGNIENHLVNVKKIYHDYFRSQFWSNYL